MRYPPEAAFMSTSRRSRVAIGTKVGLGVALIMSVVTAALYFELTARERAHLVDAKRMAAITLTEMLAGALAAPLDFEDAEAIKAELSRVAKRADVRGAIVVAPDGKVIAETGSSDRSLATAMTEVVSADQIDVVRPVLGRSDKRLAMVVVSFGLQEENAAFRESRAGILGLCLVLGVSTTVLLVYLARRQWVEPLGALVAAAEAMERGAPRPNVVLARNDELGDLAAAFNAMATAVRDREARLREVLDNMRQAIVVFSREGVVVGAPSAAAGVVFRSFDLDGRKVSEILYPSAEAWEVERRALEEWIKLAFDAGAESWERIAWLAPSEIELESEGSRRCLDLEFQPLLDEAGVLDRVMLLATDVTERRALVREKAARDQELASLRAVLGSSESFVNFLRESATRLQRCKNLLQLSTEGRGAESGARPVASGVDALSALSPSGINEVFQHVHTIRGEALTFELGELQTAAREAERALADLRGNGDAATKEREASVGVLADRLLRVEALLTAARDQYVASSPFGARALERVTVDREDVERLVALVGEPTGELALLVARLRSRPFGEVCATLPERGASWAEQLGKSARVEVQGGAELVEPRVAAVLPAILVHLVRNAVAHGIETPVERAAAGKPEQGLVSIGCVTGRDGSARFSVEDDGGGLAAEAGPDGQRRSHDHIFEEGFTTASEVTGLSGQGMGLPAAKREAARIGYDVRFVHTAVGARFEIVPGGDPLPVAGVA